MADGSCDGNWSDKRRVLLVPDGALPSGRRRPPMGPSPRQPVPGSSGALRHTPATVSVRHSLVRFSISLAQAGGGGRDFLGSQFVPPGSWADARWISETPDFSGLPVLGRDSDGAVVAADCRERLLSVASAGDDGKTSGRTAGFFDSLQRPGDSGVCCCRNRQPGSAAKLAHAMVAARSAELPPFLPLAGFTGTSSFAGAAALPRP